MIQERCHLSCYVSLNEPGSTYWQRVYPSIQCPFKLLFFMVLIAAKNPGLYSYFEALIGGFFRMIGLALGTCLNSMSYELMSI